MESIIKTLLKKICECLNLCTIPWIWGLSHVTIGHEDHVLDIGCENGNRIKNLIQKAPSGQVFGVDTSEEQIEKAKEINAENIKDGKCSFVASDPMHLPFERNYFHLVTAYNALYKWEKPEEVMKDILRVLRPGSTFLLIDRMSGCPICDYISEIKKTSCKRVYTLEAVKSMLEKVGFVDIEIDSKFGKTTIAARKAEKLIERYKTHEKFKKIKKYGNQILNAILCISIIAIILKIIKRK